MTQVTPHGTEFEKEIVIDFPVLGNVASMACSDVRVYKKETSASSSWLSFAVPECSGWPKTVRFTTKSFSLYAVGSKSSFTGTAVAYVSSLSNEQIGIIVGSVVGSVCGACCLCGMCFAIWHYNRKKQDPDAPQEGPVVAHGQVVHVQQQVVRLLFLFLCCSCAWCA